MHVPRRPLSGPLAPNPANRVAARMESRGRAVARRKSLLRAVDALAAERRRMAWVAEEKAYEFEGRSA